MRLSLRYAARIAAMALPAILLTTGLLYAGGYKTLFFEAEEGKIATGKAFKVGKYVEDPSGKVSGNKVVYLDKLDPGEKVAEDEVVYKINVPETGKYYLWARTFWSTGCGNSFYVKFEGNGANTGKRIIGGDGTYNSLHWIPLSNGGDEPSPILLKKGVVTFTLIAKESGAKVDQFMLTTDKEKLPAGINKPTAGALVTDEKK